MKYVNQFKKIHRQRLGRYAVGQPAKMKYVNQYKKIQRQRLERYAVGQPAR